MKRSILFSTVACLLAFTFLSGCGGSSGSSGTTTPPVTAPTVTSISPTSVVANSGSLTLTVNGTGFLSTTTVQVGSVAEATTYVSSTQVTATIPAQELASAAQLAVIALNGTASSGSGTTVNLQVSNPAPTITAFTPATITAGTVSPTLAVTGTGFVPTTTIAVNGSARTTTYVSAGQVNVTLTAADVASAATLSLTATNAAPGGGTSAASTIAVNNPIPGLGTLSTHVVVSSTTSPTVTITGSNYVSSSTVLLNGTARTTTYVSPTQITFQLTAADLATVGYFTVTVQNPAPIGGTASAGTLYVLRATTTPVISQVSPSQFIAGSGSTSITITGSNLFQQLSTGSYYLTSTVLWNGTALTTSGYSTFNSSSSITALVPASLLTTTGTATVTVSSLTSTPAVSNGLTVSITNPPAPTLTSLSPGGGAINTATPVTFTGTGFTSNSTVALNGTTIPSTYSYSTAMTATVPAASVQFPGNVNLTVTTPSPGGGTSGSLPYSAYVALTNNDIVYNSADGLVYASVPSSAATMANSVVGIDPVTGSITRQILVGSNPNKLALSSDGTQLFVGLDGANAVAQVNLTSGQVVAQFSLPASNYYSSANTALYLAVLPGTTSSIAVVTNSSGVTIYDAGVARTKNSSSVLNYGYGPIALGASASVLYAASGTNLYRLTIDSTGVSAGQSIYSGSTTLNSIQYDNGQIYLNSGAVLNASTGALQGTFYATTTAAATGPVVSDSTLGLAFVSYVNYSTSTNAVLAFNESSFNPTGSIPIGGMNTGNYSYTSERIVRWGQNGVALNTPTQIYFFQSTVVKDLTSSPADLAVTLSAPATTTTGTAITSTATVTNNGPNQAQGAALALTLDASLIVNSITPSQGTCGTGSVFTCNLGTLANGASATVTISATPTASGTVSSTAAIDSITYDSKSTNNQATASTTVTGGLYGFVPSISSLSPPLVQSGSSDLTLTVNGSGFNSASTVSLNGTALTTNVVSATQLTATVTAAMMANYGWASITVANPSPGGGTSTAVPLTIYAAVSVPASSIVFDPYSQQIYATVPSSATTLTGNSIVGINPFTATAGSPIPIGSQPTVMAETSDGNYLWVGLSGSNSLAQFDLVHQTLTATVPLTYTQYGSTSSTYATSLSAIPGSDSSLAIGINDSWNNFGVFDVSGNTGAFRTNLSPYSEGSNPVVADASHIYATSGSDLYRYTFNASGLTYVDATSLNGLGNSTGSFKLANGIGYGSQGGIFNPSATPPTQIATLPLPDLNSPGNSASAVSVVPDPSLQKDFLLLSGQSGTSQYALARYNLSSYLPEAGLPMPTIASSSYSSSWSLLRYGQDGIAILEVAQNYTTNQPISYFYLVRGPFVAPQLLSPGSAATLTSSSASTITHGAGNTLLTLTGSNFFPGIAVTWNGSYRTTTIVDATHVTVAIPGSDLAAAGSASLIATNPGAAASSALTITIN